MRHGVLRTSCQVHPANESPSSENHYGWYI